MRFRLIAAFSVAALLVGFVLVSASTLVSALERDRESTVRPILFEVTRFETPCDRLRREIHALSHEVSRCELAPECQGSPLLCPVALDRRVDREYARLRDALHEQCGLPRGLLDFAWEAGARTGTGGIDVAVGCEVAHDGWEAAARGEARPASYSF